MTKHEPSHPFVGALAAAALLLGTGAAQAQNGPSAPPIAPGQTVLDPDGRVLGKVERLIPGPAGTPGQVVVRTVAVRGGAPSALKVLPQGAFQPSNTPGTLVAPLAREEIDLLPDAQ
jgi:hypothetical protein